jgi:hypothetical protein
VDHREHVGHQEGDREPRKHAEHGGSPGQIGIQESDFESNSESRITLPSKKILLNNILETIHLFKKFHNSNE